jgi:hypothetical protein
MLKRMLALILCVVLLICAVPVTAGAATEDEHQRIRNQINNMYWRTISVSGVSSLRGYCGLMAGWELYFLGVTDIPVIFNGNEMYDVLSVSQYISEGYSQNLYPVSSYTLEEALNAVSCGGTRDAYNIMVGHQWTNTAAGQRYGHVTVIHAILDGKVYFTEGFVTPFNANPSQAMVCSIPEFAEYYNTWTRFEGLIHFGSGKQVQKTEYYGSRLYFASKRAEKLLAEPDANCTDTGRTVPAGERLFADYLYKNENGDLFYRVVENGKFYFVSAEHTELVCFDRTDITTENVTLPQQVKTGKDFALSGEIHTQNHLINGLSVKIRNEAGEVVYTAQVEKSGYMVDLSAKAVNNKVDISGLSAGSYTYEICCDLVNHYVKDGQVIGNVSCETVASSQFTVGDAVSGEQEEDTQQTLKDGWEYTDGNWYYYQNGAARIGWFCDNGIDYYFLENGAAATGWHTINGKARYFSETGAMRTGWMETQEGSYYLLSNGAVATGLKEISGTCYYFAENGLLAADTTVTHKGAAYQVDAGGIATPANV